MISNLCIKDGANRRALTGRWGGTRLTREVDGRQPEVGTFQRADCTIEYFQDGKCRLESRGAPDFGDGQAGGQEIPALIFSGRFEVTEDHLLRLTLQEVSSPVTQTMVGKTDDMRFVVDETSLVTFSGINDPRTGKKIGTMEASHKRKGE